MVQRRGPGDPANPGQGPELPSGPVEADSADLVAFKAAWQAFGSACYDTVAPEATYQAWLAHFVIERTELLRVVREVDFGARHLLDAEKERFRGHNLMVDITVLREPLVSLPRRAALRLGTIPDGTPDPESGLQRLADFSIISELKIASSQIGGLNPTGVLRDVRKLAALLDAAEHHYPGKRLPRAFACVLDNHPTRRVNVDRLHAQVAARGTRPDVQLLVYTRDKKSGHESQSGPSTGRTT